jgi:hypothetical protein
MTRPTAIEQAHRIRVLESALAQIVQRHVPRPGLDGTGLACGECGHLAPCPTRRLASVDPAHAVRGEVVGV